MEDRTVRLREGTVPRSIGEQSPPLKGVNVKRNEQGERGKCDKRDRCYEKWGKKCEEKI